MCKIKSAVKNREIKYKRGFWIIIIIIIINDIEVVYSHTFLNLRVFSNEGHKFLNS